MSIYKGDNLIVGPVLNTDVAPDPIPTEGSLHSVMSGGVYDALLPKEDAANKTTVVDASSTDDQYPSAKAVYNALETCEPVNIEYARDLHAPNWGGGFAITSDLLLVGYRAPKRGIFIGRVVPYDDGWGFITINGVTIGASYRGSAVNATPMPINLPASVGDVLKSNVRMQLDADFTLFFVPYKAQ